MRIITFEVGYRGNPMKGLNAFYFEEKGAPPQFAVLQLYTPATTRAYYTSLQPITVKRRSLEENNDCSTVIPSR